jgi:hypothetical protein
MIPLGDSHNQILSLNTGLWSGIYKFFYQILEVSGSYATTVKYRSSDLYSSSEKLQIPRALEIVPASGNFTVCYGEDPETNCGVKCQFFEKGSGEGT